MRGSQHLSPRPAATPSAPPATGPASPDTAVAPWSSSTAPERLAALDGAPLGLVQLVLLLSVAADAAYEDQFCGGSRGHSAATALYTACDRLQISGEIASDPDVVGTVRRQAAAAVCTVLFSQGATDPIIALERWQRGVAHDRGAAVTQLMRTTAGHVEAVATIKRAEARLASMNAASDAVAEPA